MKRLLFVYNPNSGDGRIRASLSDIADLFTKNGYEVTVYPSQAPGDAALFLAGRARDFSKIVVAGGDGMLHEAINGLSRTGFCVPVSYLPSGTTNDFANTHQISFSLLEAARQSATDTSRYVDLGLFNKEYFAYVAACGVGTQSSYETSQEEKKKFGPLAYIVNALSTVDFSHWENNCITLKAKWPQGSCQGDFLFCAISNSKYIGGSDVFIDKGFSWNDGLLEAFFIRRPLNLLDLNIILASILRKDYKEPYFVQARASWFEIESPPTSWSLDGEFGGIHETVRIETVNQVLQLQYEPEKGEPYGL